MIPKMNRQKTVKKKEISRGAEAVIYKAESEKKEFILKSRIPKKYRHPDLDKKLRKRRTKAEAKILEKAKLKKINVPELISKNEFDLSIEFIDGKKLSDILNSLDKKSKLNVIKKIAKQVTKLHDEKIIHGDLTTSNMILKNKKIFLIDFGLSFISEKIEDKAVDIHLLKQALEAKHHQDCGVLFKEFLKSYTPKNKEKILERLRAVEKRRRYRH